ncbi:unnamed protein product [Meganyctiphanes norvegica]|uniref:Protein O-mannosyl-transferase 2 n=1 Tax=Meganyctiphanes norvegica TaxID=48144 RepID=A0AAV2RDS9_MEGNR
MALMMQTRDDEVEEIISDDEKGNATKKKKKRSKGSSSNGRRDQDWWMAFFVVTVLALGTRQISLDKPAGTTWDEVHFGTFSNHYINRSFYHDVHPPLGKMLIAGMTKLTGYNASFKFDVGLMYPENFNYVAIRSMIAVLGAALVPVSFLIVWELTFSIHASLIAAVAVLSDTFIHRLNTLILLDPPLLLAILCSVYGVTKFYNQRHREWSRPWWGWLLFTGACLGTVMSIKYVGVLTVFYVGLHTVYQLFTIAGDARRPIWHVLPHTLARAIALILLPLAIYFSSFVLHFWILTEWSVNGGGFYHTKFFSAFNNTEYDNATFPEHVHYGANITVQSSRAIGGFLESWYDLFPSEYTAPCQQVTSSTIRDNELVTWTIKKVDLEKGAVFDGKDPNEAPVLVRNGDYMMWTHAETGRSLRSHGHRAPITKRNFAVCGYGDDGVGGPMETWQLIIPGVPIGAPLEVINQDFMLRHWKMNCYLKSNEHVELPKAWAYNGAKEVSCTKNPEHTGTFWHINWNVSPKLNDSISLASRSSGLLGKIDYVHHAMVIGNRVLIPTTEDLERSAKPWMWPLMWQPQTMSSYPLNETSDENECAIGMPNPVVNYTNLLCLIGVIVFIIAHYFRNIRCSDDSPEQVERRKHVLTSLCWLVLCWGLHYIPFFFMSRVLYVHHYCPSYLFSCMITGVLLGWVCDSVSDLKIKNEDDFNKRQNKKQLLAAGMAAIPITIFLLSYIIFFPLATYFVGNFSEENPQINKYLDYFYFGQFWPELGYRVSEIMEIQSSKIGRWNPGVLDNPDINATLYYVFKPNQTDFANDTLSPVHASNFSQWQAQPEMLQFLDENLPYINATEIFNQRHQESEEGDEGMLTIHHSAIVKATLV